MTPSPGGEGRSSTVLIARKNDGVASKNALGYGLVIFEEGRRAFGGRFDVERMHCYALSYVTE